MKQARNQITRAARVLVVLIACWGWGVSSWAAMGLDSRSGDRSTLEVHKVAPITDDPTPWDVGGDERATSGRPRVEIGSTEVIGDDPIPIESGSSSIRAGDWIPVLRLSLGGRFFLLF